MLLGLGIGMLLLGIFFYQFILRISQPLSIFHNDAYLMTYVLKHYISLLKTGDISNWISFPMFYGFKNSVFFAEFFPIHAIIGYPMYVLTKNIFFVSNALVLSTVYFSYGSMFLLSWYITRRMWPSIIAGIIFLLIHFLANFESYIVVECRFIPLIVLALNNIVKQHRHGMFPLRSVCGNC
jgi:hypothetical protein